MSFTDFVFVVPSHTLFIVGSYAGAVVVMVIEVWQIRARHRRARAQASKPIDLD